MSSFSVGFGFPKLGIARKLLGGQVNIPGSCRQSYTQDSSCGNTTKEYGLLKRFFTFPAGKEAEGTAFT